MPSGSLVKCHRSLCSLRNFKTSGTPGLQAEQMVGMQLKEGDGGNVHG